MVIQPIKKKCPVCGGSGKKRFVSCDEPFDDECPRCEGLGYIWVRPRNLPPGPLLCCGVTQCRGTNSH
jgi:DnaJ-class molecular chaperone